MVPPDDTPGPTGAKSTAMAEPLAGPTDPDEGDAACPGEALNTKSRRAHVTTWTWTRRILVT